MSDRRSGSPRRARSRLSQCGSKGQTSAYDPEVGTAAAQEAATAQAAQTFDENYETTVVEPALAAETAQTQQSTADQNQLFGIEEPLAAAQAAETTQYGIPAQSAYYKMVQDYSAPQEQESEAEASLGDMRTSEAATNATLARQQQSLGINPSSGASQALASDATTNNAAAEAGAETRARYNAKQLGMTLTGDAATFSNTGVSNLTNLGNTASSTANSGTQDSATGTSSANSSAGVQNAGYSLANSAYGNNLDAYSRLAAADIPVQAQSDAGFGQALGALGSLALSSVSDRRLKKNIRRLGVSRQGLPIYAFEYTFKPGTQIGHMADEVEQFMPEAVNTDAHGIKSVNYPMLRAA